MGVTLREEAGGKVLIVDLSGKLIKQDYETLGPRVDALVAQHGKIRIQVNMSGFHGWSMGALWEDIKFDWKHFSHIERLALVGDSKWEAGMAMFCKPFTRATIRYFNIAKAEEAHTWIMEGLPVPAGA